MSVTNGSGIFYCKCNLSCTLVRPYRTIRIVPTVPRCYPHPRNTGSQNFSTCEMDRSWRHLHRSWLASRQQFQIFRGAWQNTPPTPHPPTRSNWKCARAYLYSLRHTAQSLEHVTQYQRHRYRSLSLSRYFSYATFRTSLVNYSSL